MVAEMTYETVSNVVDSWEQMRRIPNYQEIAGVKLFRIYFELEPRAAKVFSFSDAGELDAEFFKSKRLVEHAKHYMAMVDRAIGLLGPDIEMLTEIMLKLGASHIKFGVQPSFYPPMGAALLTTLEDMLAEKFTLAIKNSWLECYQALAYDMIRAKGGKS